MEIPYEHQLDDDYAASIKILKDRGYSDTVIKLVKDSAFLGRVRLFLNEYTYLLIEAKVSPTLIQALDTLATPKLATSAQLYAKMESLEELKKSALIEKNWQEKKKLEKECDEAEKKLMIFAREFSVKSSAQVKVAKFTCSLIIYFLHYRNIPNPPPIATRFKASLEEFYDKRTPSQSSTVAFNLKSIDQMTAKAQKESSAISACWAELTQIEKERVEKKDLTLNAAKYTQIHHDRKIHTLKYKQCNDTLELYEKMLLDHIVHNVLSNQNLRTVVKEMLDKEERFTKDIARKTEHSAGKEEKEETTLRP